MALMTSYLLKSSILGDFFNALRTARAPDKFTHKFLKDLEFGSSNDRLLIGVLKGLGFLDEDGTPTDRYYKFLDQSQSGKILADGIREAYDDLFAINKMANTLSVEDVRGKFKTLTQGQKSENVINLMAATFRALCDQADWSAPNEKPIDAGKNEIQGDKPEELPPPLAPGEGTRKDLQLHYNIQVVLPESRDSKVYDAIFASLRRHLL